MNELQEKLYPYVEQKANLIMNEKEASGKSPLIADLVELLRTVREDILECMRQLCRDKKYIGGNTLNNPYLKKK